MAKPLVFLSWSTESSKKMALALKEVLPLLIPSTEAFMSEEDISKGSYPLETIRDRLGVAFFGVICVTAESIERPWPNYEAGALANSLKGKTVPYLLGLETHELKTLPLAGHQAARANRDDTWKMVRDINGALNDDLTHPEAGLKAFFEKWCPDLEERLKSISIEAKPPKRDPADTNDEILATMRTIERQVQAVQVNVAALQAEPRRALV